MRWVLLSVMLTVLAQADVQGAEEFLPTTRRQIDLAREVAVADDGLVWAIDAAQTLIRWEGGQWRPVKTLSPPLPGILLAGLDGVLLAQGGRETMLFQRDQQIAAGQLFETLEEHRELLARAFAAERLPERQQSDLMLCADRDGKLWCQFLGSVRVLVDGRWHDATEALLAAGSRKAEARYLAPIGDGSQVYLTDLEARAKGGLSLIGEYRDGKLAFRNAPHTVYETSLPTTLRDQAGGLWIRQDNTGNSKSFTSNKSVKRLTAEGATTEYKTSGHAQLCDAAGNVWLADTARMPPSEFHIWRNGEIVQKLPVMGFNSRSMLCSDRPGSAYAITSKGLQHFVADAPEFKQYRSTATYPLGNVTGIPVSQAYSRSGYLVLTTRTNMPQPAMHVWMLKLPGHP